MHELSIATGIVDAVLAEAEARSLRQVSSVHLRLGTLSGVDRDALLFSFPIACDGTPLEGAELVIEEAPVRVMCEACEIESTPESVQLLTCPRCHGAARVIAGTEIELRAFAAVEQEVQT